MTSTIRDTGSDRKTRADVKKRLLESLYIEAGAGTGKTEALVSRLTELLATGTAQPDQVAAITFTKAAAFEMRSRLRTRLEERARLDLGDQEKEYIQSALISLDTLSIQTIHAFALSLLREYPLDAGLPPVISSIDGVQASVEFDNRWQEWFAEQIEADRQIARALSTAQRMGLNRPVDLLREVASQFSEHHDVLAQQEFAYTGPASPEISAALLRTALDEAVRAVTALPVQDDTMCGFVYERVQPELESLLAGTGDADSIPALELVELQGFRANRRGSKGNWQRSAGGAEDLTRLRELLSDLQDEIDRVLNMLRQQTLSKLLSTARSFALEYAEDRFRTGNLTFNDQLVLSRQLLAYTQKVRQEVRHRYRFILVDEFQDTDPVQLELLRLIVTRDNGQVIPGSIFIVGDPKQSIYRFRGADPISAGMFSEEIASAGDLLTLTGNHRSLPGVLQWINAVFSSWMKEGGGSGQAKYRNLEWEEPLEAEQAKLNALPVRWFGEEHEATATDSRRDEFRDIAKIAQVAGSGAFSVRNKDNSWRSSKFSDVAVLTRGRTDIEILEEELNQRRIPYVFDSQTSIFTSQDIRDLHACLSAIDDPSDEVAVVAALRSPAFSCPDTDLLRWKQAGGVFTYLPETSPAKPESVSSAFAILKRFHLLSRDIDTPSLIEEFIRDRNLRELAMLARQGPDRVRRLDMVVELSRAISQPGSPSEKARIRDFIRWMQKQSEDNARMPEQVSETAPVDAVRIMTIHASKGLEFPIVILTSTSGGRRGTASLQIMRRNENKGTQLEVQLGNKDLGLRTEGVDDAIEHDKAESEFEDVRLLYVAATRARDHLFVSMHRSNKSKNALSAKIEEHLQGSESLWQKWQKPLNLPEPKTSQSEPPETIEQYNAWLAERTEVVQTASLRGYTTPTALKPPTSRAPLQAKEPTERIDDEAPKPGRAATELGRAVHGVLQHIRLTDWTESELVTLSEQMATDHGDPDRAGEVTELARAALNTATMQRAVKAAQRSEAWREVSVAAALPEIAGELEGQIDLLFTEEDGSITIVDHKTDREREGITLDEAAEPYLNQMAAYAWCVEGVTGLKVQRAVLIFSSRARAGLLAEYEVTDLDAHIAEVLQLASDQVSGTAASD